MIRTDAGCSVSRFAELIGVPRRTYCARLARLRAGNPPKGPWPAPVVDRIEPDVAKYAEAWPARRLPQDRRDSRRGWLRCGLTLQRQAGHGPPGPVATGALPGRAAPTRPGAAGGLRGPARAPQPRLAGGLHPVRNDSRGHLAALPGRRLRHQGRPGVPCRCHPGRHGPDLCPPGRCRRRRGAVGTLWTVIGGIEPSARQLPFTAPIPQDDDLVVPAEHRLHRDRPTVIGPRVELHFQTAIDESGSACLDDLRGRCVRRDDMRLELSQVRELVAHGFSTRGLGRVVTPPHPFRRRDAPGSQDEILHADLAGAKASGNPI